MTQNTIPSLYYITRNGVVFLKDISKEFANEFFESLVHKSFYRGDWSEVKMVDGTIYCLMMDEVVSYQRDDTETDQGWNWHTLVKTLSGEVLLNETRGDYNGEQPDARFKSISYIGRKGNGL